MSLTLYYHPVSQPSRAVHATLLLGKVEFVPKVIDIMKGEAKSPEYTAIIAYQKVPAIQEGDFTLFESHAILRYLATTNPSLNSFYPQDPKQRAQVDCYLDWHQSGTRKVTFFVREFFFYVKFMGKEAPANREERLNEVEAQFTFIENFYLGGEKKFKYIANQPNLTIADLSAHAEISTLQFINYDFSKFPLLQAWFENISNIPEVKEAYATHNQMIKQFNPELNDFNQRTIS